MDATLTQGINKRIDNRKKNIGLKVFRTLGNVVFIFMIILAVVMLLYFVQSKRTGVNKIAGYQMYAVLSGSMNPAFDTGSLIFIKEISPQEIKARDIITFRGKTGQETTHRVMEVNYEDSLSFVTRGDANNVNDPIEVQPENVIGKAYYYIPHLGYVFGFAQQPIGLFTLIIIPGILLVLLEVLKLVKYSKAKNNPLKEEMNKNDMEQGLTNQLFEKDRKIENNRNEVSFVNEVPTQNRSSQRFEMHNDNEYRTETHGTERTAQATQYNQVSNSLNEKDEYDRINHLRQQLLEKQRNVMKLQEMVKAAEEETELQGYMEKEISNTMLTAHMETVQKLHTNNIKTEQILEETEKNLERVRKEYKNLNVSIKFLKQEMQDKLKGYYFGDE